MKLLKNTGTQPVADDDIVWVVYNDDVFDYGEAWAFDWSKTDEKWGVNYWSMLTDLTTERQFFYENYK